MQPLPTERRTDILLIDDSLTDLRLLMKLMSSRHMRVSVASEGMKGYRQAELLRPGLILLDVRMPGMDGFATCRLLKENFSTRFIPVIFLTAATDLVERLQGCALGGVDYISKPFNEQEVLARVGVHLELLPRACLPPQETPRETGRISTTLDGVLVSSAQKILRQFISNPPSLDSLSKQLGTNRRRIVEAFHKQCGLSTFNWLREERLRQAQYLVGSTDTPISQIAEYLGFATPTNFTKAFRERYNTPPRTFRQEMRARQAINDS
jgi:DNA-binding response OmpR family regulator